MIAKHHSSAQPAAQRASLRDRAAQDDAGRHSLSKPKAPSRAHVQNLAVAVGRELQAGLHAAGLSTATLGIAFDAASGQLRVQGSAADAARLSRLLATRPGLGLKVQSLFALSSHAIVTGRALRFDAEYRAAQNTADANLVLAKHADLLCGRVPDPVMSLSFDARHLLLKADAMPWLGVKTRPDSYESQSHASQMRGRPNEN